MRDLQLSAHSCKMFMLKICAAAGRAPGIGRESRGLSELGVSSCRHTAKAHTTRRHTLTHQKYRRRAKPNQSLAARLATSQRQPLPCSASPLSCPSQSLPRFVRRHCPTNAPPHALKPPPSVHRQRDSWRLAPRPPLYAVRRPQPSPRSLPLRQSSPASSLRQPSASR